MTHRTILAVAAAVLLSAGCGQNEYESRLAQTADYFSHVNRLNANLKSAVGFGGLQLRLPLQFDPLADDPDTEVDETQPYFLDLELPGLVGAYRAPVLVDVDGQDEEHPAFLYVMSNGPELSARASGDQSVDPLTLTDRILEAVQTAFGVVLPPGADGDGVQPNVRYPERLPRIAVYDTTTDYTAVRLVPAEPFGSFAIPMEYTLYAAAGPGDQQVALMLAAPEQPVPSDELRKRVTMMLETARIDAPSGGGGARPSAF